MKQSKIATCRPDNRRKSFFIYDTLPLARYYLASHGHDTRAIQDYLGHKNIQHTVRYTAMAPQRFENFWTD